MNTITKAERIYNLQLGLFVLYGCILSAILAVTCQGYIERVHPLVFLVCYLALCFLGSFMVNTENVVINFIGYNLIVLPVGLLLTSIVGTYAKVDIMASLFTVCFIAGTIMILATINPKIFAYMGRGLMVCLLIGLVTEIISLILGYSGHLFDWLFVLIFSGLFGYDWVKAQEGCDTSDAIRSASQIYLDLVNIFIRLLSIFGSGDD